MTLQYILDGWFASTHVAHSPTTRVVPRRRGFYTLVLFIVHSKVYKDIWMVSCSFVHLCCVMTPCFFLFCASSHPYIPLYFEEMIFPLGTMMRNASTILEYVFSANSSFRRCGHALPHRETCVNNQTGRTQNAHSSKSSLYSQLQVLP